MSKHLHLDFTSNCNLRCRHCYNSDYFNKDLYVDLDMVNSIIKSEKITHIHILGGEPLYNPDFFFKFIRELPCDVDLSISTNGVNLNENSVISILEDSRITQITISLDGFNAPANDIVRGNGIFDKVKDNLRGLYEMKKNRNKNLIISIAEVLTPDNINLLKNIDEMFYEKIYDNLMISVLFMEGSAQNNYILDKKYYYDFHKEILNLIRQLNNHCINIYYDLPPLTVDFINSQFPGSIRNKKLCNCYANNEIKYMNVYGKLYNCGPEFVGKKFNQVNEFCIECPYFKSCNNCKLGYYFQRFEYCKIAVKLIEEEFSMINKDSFNVRNNIYKRDLLDKIILVDFINKKSCKIPKRIYCDGKIKISNESSIVDKALLISLVNSNFVERIGEII